MLTNKHGSRFVTIQGKKEGIQWVLPTNRSIAWNVEMISLSRQRSKSSFQRKVTPTSQNAVFHAGRRGKQIEAAIQDPEGICKNTRPYAPSAAKIRKYRSSRDREDRFIAVLVIVK